MIHWQCRDKIGQLSVVMFWQLHYDVTLFGDYTVYILRHQTLCSEDINKMQQASSWNSCSLEAYECHISLQSNRPLRCR